MQIEEVFSEVSEQMRADLRRARVALSHAGMKGASAENIFRTFLRDYLPRSLDISSGTLVDATGNVSRQLDVIISDAAKTPVFFRNEADRVIPVECAYAVIEVKSKLDSKELEGTFKNMLSVRELKKTAYYKNTASAILYGREWDIWPTNYFVFAYDSTEIGNLRDRLEAMHQQHSLPEWSRVDCVGVLNKGVILNQKPQGNLFSISALPEPGSHLSVSKTVHSLLFFYTLITDFLNQVDMPTFRFKDYLGGIAFEIR